MKKSVCIATLREKKKFDFAVTNTANVSRGSFSLSLFFAVGYFAVSGHYWMMTYSMGWQIKREIRQKPHASNLKKMVMKEIFLTLKIKLMNFYLRLFRNFKDIFFSYHLRKYVQRHLLASSRTSRFSFSQFSFNLFLQPFKNSFLKSRKNSAKTRFFLFFFEKKSAEKINSPQLFILSWAPQIRGRIRGKLLRRRDGKFSQTQRWGKFSPS